MAKITNITEKTSFVPFAVVIETEVEAAILWAALNSTVDKIAASAEGYSYMKKLILSQAKLSLAEDQHFKLWEVVDDELKARNLKR